MLRGMDQLIWPPKPSWVTRAFDAFRENPSLIVSTASLIVAIAALFLTYIAQARDAYYRELSIRPRIAYRHLIPDFTISLTNFGLGPAVIKKMTFNFDGKCYDLTADYHPQEMSGAQYAELANEAAKYFFVSLAKDFGVDMARDEGPILSIDIYGPDTLLPQGEKVDLFSLLPAQQRLLQERLKKLDAATASKLMLALHDIARHAPLHIEYCSLSGAYCESLGKACTPAKGHATAGPADSSAPAGLTSSPRREP
jgi:hypothetical protein